MIRGNVYEMALEAYMQWHRIPYVAVNETRRSFLADERVKSLDFLVISARDQKLLIDVKGHRYPGGNPERPRRVWECWAKTSDIDGLERWADHLGPDFRPLLVFVYQLATGIAAPDGEELWTWHDHKYLLRAIDAREYRQAMRRRSPRWGTVWLAKKDYDRLAQPFPFFLREPAWSLDDSVPF